VAPPLMTTHLKIIKELMAYLFAEKMLSLKVSS
jgi:hypothetical protein